MSLQKLTENLILALLFLLPTYLLRFKVYIFPSNILEIIFFITFLCFIILLLKQKNYYLILNFYRKNKLFGFFLISFITSSFIAIFWSNSRFEALGEWRAFILEPIIFLQFLIYFRDNKKFIKKTFFVILLSSLLTCIFAIFQKFTGFFVPYDFWEKNNTFRVTAWYGFPNGIGLLVGAMPALTIIFLTKINTNLNKKIFIFIINFFIFSFAAFFAKSTGALIAILGTLFLFLIIYKKTRILTLISAFLFFIIFLFLPTENKIKKEVLFGDRSGQIRIHIWKETIEFLKDNSLKGAGIDSYTQKIVPYHKKVNGENIEIFHHPHNIFLSIYVNFGFFGFISFSILLIIIFKKALIKNPYSILPITAILIMGLVDTPFLKNDLSILFFYYIFIADFEV